MLEDIMIFALNVARAVEFLHAQKVTTGLHLQLGIHRLLLLKA